MDLKEEAAIGGDPATHWYYLSKAKAIKSLIGDTPVDAVLDVGAGSGVFSRMLLDEGRAQSAICVDPNYSDAQLAANDARMRFVRNVDGVDAPLVMMIDVIEHVDDDVALISEYAEQAPAGARFLISVPAFNFLWSSHDEFLEHRRRYTLDRLLTAVRAGGLEPVSSRYFFGLLFPAAAAMRLADRATHRGEEATSSAMKPAPEWLNRALVAVHDIEARALLPFNRLAGVTAFCLAEKRALATPACAA